MRQTFLAVRRIDDIVPSSDERPSICGPLEFAILDQEYFHRRSVPTNMGCSLDISTEASSTFSVKVSAIF
jgi:hypothetical protein